MNFKINGKTHSLKKLSELSFKEYNEIIVKREVVDIIDYISVFSDSDREKVLNSDVSIKNPSLPALHSAIFDVDQAEVLKNPKGVVFFKGEYISMDSVSISTIGKDYIHDMYLKKLDEKKINIFEMCMYSLAIGLSSSSDTEEIAENYSILSESNWIDVLPQGFFLIKNSRKKLLKRVKLYLICILALKRISFLMLYSLKKLALQEKKYRLESFAKN